MLQQYVSLRKEDHTYWDLDGRQYVSVSRVLDNVQEKFDVEKKSRDCAGKGKYVGMSQEQVKKAWSDNSSSACDHGTRIHEALERYTTHFDILPEDNDLEPMIKSVCADYNGYKRVYNEAVLYHPEYMIAGTADKVLQLNTRDSFVDLADYKTNIKKKIQFYSEYNKFMLGPVSHLSDCNYNRYSLQLSIYALMCEHLTKGKVRTMWIRYIPADNFLNHVRIPVSYMREEAIAVMEYYVNKPKVESKSFLPEIPNFDL